MTEAEQPGHGLDGEAVPAWFRNALDTMLDLVGIQRAVRDEAGRIIDFEVVYTNRATVDVAGRTAEHLTGTRLRDLYPNIGPIVEHYTRVVESGESLSVDELPYEDHIDGRAVSGFYALQVTRFGDGVLVVSRDVSEAVRNRRLLESSNRRLESAQALAHVGVFTVDEASEAVWFSDELRRIFGFGPHDTLPGRDELVRTMFSSTQRDTIDEAQRVVEDQARPVVFETVIERPDGDARSLLVHVEREVVDGVPTGLWGTAQDITPLRATQDRLDEAQVRLGSQTRPHRPVPGRHPRGAPDGPRRGHRRGLLPGGGRQPAGGRLVRRVPRRRAHPRAGGGRRVGPWDPRGRDHGPAAQRPAGVRLRGRRPRRGARAPQPLRRAEPRRRPRDGALRHLRPAHAGVPVVARRAPASGAGQRRWCGRRPHRARPASGGVLRAHRDGPRPPADRARRRTAGPLHRRADRTPRRVARRGPGTAARRGGATGGAVGRDVPQARDLCVEDDHEDDVCILTLSATGEGPATG